MIDERPKVRYRKFLVDKRFQFKYTFLVVAFSSIIFAILGYKLYQLNKANTEILKIQNLDVMGVIGSADQQILGILLGFFGLQVVSLFVLGILLTHRIAGPVHRVHGYLEEMAETGKVVPLHSARSQDEFKEFFDSLSAVIDKIQAKNDSQKAKLQELKDKLGTAEGDPQKMADCKRLAEELEALL